MKTFETEKSEIRLYLTFKTDAELLAFDVTRVREILNLCPITRVPMARNFMKGVVNLRGSIIPVIDLRLRFGLDETESTSKARIVVMEFEFRGNNTVVGVLTDSVHDVIGISDDNISPPQETGSHWRTKYIKGIGKYKDEFILLLDIHQVFAKQEGFVERADMEGILSGGSDRSMTGDDLY